MPAGEGAEVMPWKLESANRQVATGVTARGHADASELLSQLGLDSPRSVLAVFGGAATLGKANSPDVSRRLGQALVRAAAVSGAAIVDGGTDAGIMAAIGAAAERTPVDTLLGVAPAALVAHPGGSNGAGLEPLERHHSHFILSEGSEWGAETELLVEAAAALAGDCPIVAVVVGGGEITTEEALRAVRRGWPVFVLVGTGGTADTLAGRGRAGDDRLDEILADGDVRALDAGAPDDVARQLAWQLNDAPVVKMAWERFARYDALAARLRRSFQRLQAGILALGVLATLIALVDHSLGAWATGSRAWVHTVLHWSVVLTTIAGAVLVAYAARVQAGKRWVLLRGAAETLKAEIYRYRTRTGPYRVGDASDHKPPLPRGPESELTERMTAVDAMLMKTEVSGAALVPYRGPLPPRMYGASAGDDGLSPLSPERYLELRVGDQLGFYRPKSAALERQWRRLQLAAIVAGGAGTFLATVGLEIWVGLTTAMGGAAFAYLGYLQIEPTLVAYNQAATRLESLEAWWRSLPKPDRDTESFTRLVEQAESVLHTEQGTWVQQMNEALEQLSVQQRKTTQCPEVLPRDK